MSSCSSHCSASSTLSDLEWNWDALIVSLCIHLAGFLMASPTLVLTFALPFSLDDCTLITNQPTLRLFWEAHFLRPCGFQAWRDFISKFGTVQSVLHLKWSYLFCDYNPWLSGMRTGALILSSTGTEFAFCPHQQFYWGNEYDKLFWHLGPVVSAYL